MKNENRILSDDWSLYDGNHKSVVHSESLTSKDLEVAVRSAYRKWAEHCRRTRPQEEIRR